MLCRCYQQDIGAAGTADLERLQKIEKDIKNKLEKYELAAMTPEAHAAALVAMSPANTATALASMTAEPQAAALAATLALQSPEARAATVAAMSEAQQVAEQKAEARAATLAAMSQAQQVAEQKAEQNAEQQNRDDEDYDRLKEQLSMLELEQVQLLITHLPALHVHCLITSSYSLPH